MALSRIAIASGTATAGATTCDASSLNLQAGDICVVICGYNPEGLSLTVQDSDGSTNPHTVISEVNSGNGQVTRGAYRLSATADSTAVIRATVGSGPYSDWGIVVVQFRPDAGDTVTYESGPNGGGSTWDAGPLQTATMSVTGDDWIAVCGFKNGQGATYSSFQIAGGAVDASQEANGLIVGVRAFTSDQSSIRGQVSVSTSCSWSGTLMAIRSSGSGAASITCAGIPAYEYVGQPTLPVATIAYPGSTPHPNVVLMSDPRVLRGNPVIVGAGGIASEAAVGSPHVAATPSDEGIVGAGGIASAEALGQPTVSTGGGAQEITGAGGIASGAALGQPGLAAGITAAEIASGEAFGSPALAAGISATGIASGEAVGSPALTAGISPAGIASGAAVGSPSLAASIVAAGIASVEAVGSPAVAAVLAMAGIPSGEALGQPTVYTGAGIIGAGGIPSGVALGYPIISILKTRPTGSSGVPAAMVLYFPTVKGGAFGAPLVKTDAFRRADSRKKP